MRAWVTLFGENAKVKFIKGHKSDVGRHERS